MVDYVLIIRLLAIRCQEPHAVTVHRLLRIRMAALPVALRVAYEPGSGFVSGGRRACLKR